MAAQDAELQLKVSLDLTFFKQQLAGLGSSAAGYRLPINIKFDRLSIQKELNTLGTNIRRRTYRLNVETNLQAEIENASKLAKALDELSKSRKSAQGAINQQLGLGALLPGPQDGGLGSKDVEKLYRAAARAGIVEYNKEIARRKASAVAALEAVGSDSVKGLLNGLNSEDEKLRAAATYLGETLIKTVKGILGIASPSREFKKIGQNVGEGFQQGMLSSMDKAFDAVEGLMRARMKVLDTIARGMFRMAGIDPAAIRAEAAQRRALPGVNFPATIPPRNISIGPSSTGRALPSANLPNIAGALPPAYRGLPFGFDYSGAPQGKASADISGGLVSLESGFISQMKSRYSRIAKNFLFGVETQVVDLFDSTQQAVNSAVDQYIANIQSKLLQEARRNVSVKDLGSVTQKILPPGSTSRAPLMLPPAGGATPPGQMRFNAVTGGAVLGQPGFMQAPSIPSAMKGSGMQPSGRGGGGGRFGGFGGLIPGGGDFRRAMGGVNLPGTGVIRELGQEFGFATKQVILFGQAYKLLAFIQDLPAQVGAAVGQLQSFRNTLNAVTPSTEEARASNELLLELMEKYNVPLQSARDGFTKLYASMAPAGFSGDEIRELFTGITKAAATFGMSADKVDRVNYAFAQMASKGQIMSEELKGQLGDVLPGAMALFAEAAGFEGPKAIQDFSAALEDGAYKGEAMVALLKNVTVVMNKEFGPGAEGAARTFQGVMNRMQNSMTLLYESFEPVAVGFLNSVVAPMTDGIKQLTDGLNAFFTGTAAKTAGGFAIAQELERLRPAFDGIGQNVATFVTQLGQLASVALDVSKVFLQIAGNPIVGYLAKLYAIALPINIALGVMRGLWASNALQLVIFNARVASGTTTLSAFRGMMAATGATAKTTAASIRTAGITLRTFFATTGVGLVVVGISMLIEKILTMNQALADTKAKAMGAAQAIRAMSQTEARQAAQQYEGGAKSLEGLNKQIEEGKMKGKAWIQVTGQQAKALQDAGVAVSNVRGSLQVQPTRVPGAFQKLTGLAAEARYRERSIQSQEQQAQSPAVLGAIPAGEAEGKTKKGKELKDFAEDEARVLRERLALQKTLIDVQSDLTSSQKELAKAELDYEYGLDIVEAQYQAAIKTLGEYKEAQRGTAQASMQNAAVLARESVTAEYRKALLGDLVKLSENYESKTGELQDSVAALSAGQKDLSETEKVEAIIKRETTGLTERQLGIIGPYITKIREQAQAVQALSEEEKKLQENLEKTKNLREAQAGLGLIGGGLRAGFVGEAANVFEQAMGKYGDIDYATQMANLETAAMQLRSVFEGLQGAIAGVGSAFGSVLTEGIASMVSGTATAKEVFANFLQSVAQALAQAASQMIATYIAIGIARLFAGFSPGRAADYGGGKVATDAFQTNTLGLGPSIGTPGSAVGFTFANGGIASGGFRAFANGGVVSGPTLGLVGEGRYNEAIVPLPDGKSIPVSMDTMGVASATSKMIMERYRPTGSAAMTAESAAAMEASGGAGGAGGISVNYDVVAINSMRFVTEDQFQQGVAAAAAEGAKRGERNTLQSLQRYRSVRSKIGLR